MTPAISVAGLTRRYRGTLALDAVSFDIEPGSVTGLLGRNGAGKTTLLRIVAGQEFPSAGGVRVLGACPVENENALRRVVFVREDQRYPDYGSRPAFQVRHAPRAASFFYPNWDGDLAAALVADFGLPPGRRVAKLSRGMRSALGIVIGLAARAEVTLFDEPYAGLDPVARKLFYDRMLADYAEHPRTVLLSTHLQVSYILAGPWYLTWLTSFVGLAVLFVYGIWWGLVYWRWDVAGLLVFAAAQVIVGAGGALAAARTGAWPAIGRFFTTLSAAGLTGVLVALAVVLLAGGYTTMRRVTV